MQQWCAFSRKWFLFDARWQNPFHSAHKITPILEGKHKPVYHPMNDCGDHVVVINSRHIALLGQEWTNRVYLHHTGFPTTHISNGGAKWISAWQLHSRDPTLILWKACYNNLYGGLQRRATMARLHIYPDEEVPDDIMRNVSDQVAQVRPRPRRRTEIPEEEAQEFPRIYQYPENYTLK